MNDWSAVPASRDAEKAPNLLERAA